jgi:hypothetical protein
MEEKKLTDIELLTIQQLEHEKKHLLKEKVRIGIEPEDQLVYVNGTAIITILDLIHRLQDENERLKSTKYRASWKAKFFKAQAEIERLTEERDKLKVIVNHNCDPFPKWQEAIIKENAELQKQVDELKSQFLSTCENCHLKKDIELLSYQKQQAVKDTAKEILTELDLFFKGTTFRKGYEFKKIDEKLKEIAKRNGIEVK